MHELWRKFVLAKAMPKATPTLRERLRRTGNVSHYSVHCRQSTKNCYLKAIDKRHTKRNKNSQHLSAGSVQL